MYLTVLSPATLRKVKGVKGHLAVWNFSTDNVSINTVYIPEFRFESAFLTSKAVSRSSVLQRVSSRTNRQQSSLYTSAEPAVPPGERDDVFSLQIALGIQKRTFLPTIYPQPNSNLDSYSSLQKSSHQILTL